MPIRLTKTIIAFLLIIGILLAVLYFLSNKNVSSIDNYIKRDTQELNEVLETIYFPPLNGDYLVAANDMLNGIYHIPPYGTFNFKQGIVWDGEEGTNRSYLRLLHAHFFLNDLIVAYEETSDPRYIQQGYEIIADWIDKNPYEAPLEPMAWHDETTPRRLITWIRFFDTARSVLTPQQLELLVEQMRFHAELLTDDSFYSHQTNHGMSQDEALIVFSYYFSDMAESDQYERLAKERLQAYFEYILSEEGVHKEHSPSYHNLIADFLHKYRNYFFAIGDSKFARYLADKYDQMAHFATFVIKPDGKWPLLGDTFPHDHPYATLWEDRPYYQFARSKGKQGNPPVEVDVVFPEAGYAIFRDSWERGEEGTYILFTAAYHTAYHKHSDDLSIWLYADGDLISEAGPNGYNMDDPNTQYAYSSFAHNTLIVDDEGLPRVDDKFEATYIVDYRLGENVSSVTGINERYEGVTHLRTLTYDKTENKVSVADKITSHDTHNYKLLWHLAPQLEPEIDGRHVVVRRDGEVVMTITVSASSTFNLFDIYGDNKGSYPYKGLHFHKRGKLIETHVLVIEVEADSADVTTTFQLHK